MNDTTPSGKKSMSRETTVLSKQDVINCAKEIRKKYFSSSEPIERPVVGIRKILKELRGKVVISHDAEDETITINKDNSFVITIPQNSSVARDMFTIAHELGHYFLHIDKEKPGPCKFYRKGNDRQETEANWFAAELLMPAEIFKKISAQYKCDPRQVSSYFGVSQAAARVRMSVLGLIDN